MVKEKKQVRSTGLFAQDFVVSFGYILKYGA